MANDSLFVLLGSISPECNISDKELITFNVKELNRFLKTKGKSYLKFHLKKKL